MKLLGRLLVRNEHGSIDPELTAAWRSSVSFGAFIGSTEYTASQGVSVPRSVQAPPDTGSLLRNALPHQKGPWLRRSFFEGGRGTAKG